MEDTGEASWQEDPRHRIHRGNTKKKITFNRFVGAQSSTHSNSLLIRLWPSSFEFHACDWPEKSSGQPKAGNSNASGTGSVRVIAQGLSRSYSKLSPTKIPATRLTAPGSPRMAFDETDY